jgi:hypothetical protein
MNIIGCIALCAFIGLAFGQSNVGRKIEVTGVHKTPVLTIDPTDQNGSLFYYSDLYKGLLFRGIMTNVSGQDLLGVSLIGKLHKKDGTIITFTLQYSGSDAFTTYKQLHRFKDLPNVLDDGVSYDVRYLFSTSDFPQLHVQDEMASIAELDSLVITVELEDPAKVDRLSEDYKQANAAKAAEEAATEKRRELSEAAAKKAEAAAAMAAAKAAQVEARRARAACVVIYRNTVDKKISDLTVREEQQVRACQALGLYLPQ